MAAGPSNISSSNHPTFSSGLYQIAHIARQIGTSNDDIVKVFEATCRRLGPDANEILTTQVAVKYAHMDYEPFIFHFLELDVKRSLLLPTHTNIIGITRDQVLHNGRYYCVHFPLIAQSLRSIMQARFSNGFPEKCIAVALKKIVQAVHFMHTKRRVHLEINAGNIFFDQNEIKLAYSGTIYQTQNQTQNPMYLLENSISEWAAAPESPCERFAHKTDVWWIGITALELAYGGLRVRNKDELKKRFLKIEAYNKLPDTWNDEEETGIRRLNSMLFGKRKFSRAFQEMVISCLWWRPQNRPTVAELLDSKFFKKCEDMDYFSRVVNA